jgi:pimeloyl-ACP methyl ester carboxylesterase
VIEVETTWGPVWFDGEDRGLPLVMVLFGYREVEDAWRPAGLQPTIDYLRVHLPGNHCPELREPSLEAFSGALDEALTTRFPGRPTFVIGLSLGALVALSLRFDGVRRLMLIEPPLRTHDLWPVANWDADASRYEARLLWNVLGVGKRRLEPRDYTPLLAELKVPARVFVAGEPLLPRRSVTRLPSFVDEPSRAALVATPGMHLTTVMGTGHALPHHALKVISPIIAAETQLAFRDPETP